MALYRSVVMIDLSDPPRTSIVGGSSWHRADIRVRYRSSALSLAAGGGGRGKNATLFVERKDAGGIAEVRQGRAKKRTDDNKHSPTFHAPTPSKNTFK